MEEGPKEQADRGARAGQAEQKATRLEQITIT